MRHLERFPVWPWFMHMPDGSSPDPAQQFARDDRAATAKDHPRPGFPHQRIYELVKLLMGHAIESSSFAA
jgi:hypothetical protein